MPTVLAALSLAFFSAHAQTAVTVAVNKADVLHSNFSGLGFNIPVDPSVDETAWNTVVGKRLKEVSVSNYARVFTDVSSYAPTRGNYTWNSEGQKAWDRMMALLKANNTDVFVTNGYWGSQPAFLGGNKEITQPAMLADWVDVQLTSLNQWINVKGFTNIKQWTVTNEFNGFDATGGSGAFDATHRANWFRHAQLVKDGLAGRNLTGKVQVIGPDDVGRVDSWRSTIPDAIKNHPNLLDVYEVHDYPQSDYSLQDANGNWFKDDDSGADYLAASNYEKRMKKFSYGKYLVRDTGKDFIIGEFGGQATSDDMNGTSRRDTYNQHDAGAFGNFVVDYGLAGLNTGIKALAYWWFHDTGQNGTGKWEFFNDTGAMADERGDWKARPEYYAYGLVARYVHKNSTVYKTTSSSDLVHVATVKNNADGKYAVIVNNRETGAINLSLSLPGENGKYRKFVYDPANIPTNGDLPKHAKEVQVVSGAFTDAIGAGQVVVYTNEFDEAAPAKVNGVTTAGKTTSWSPNTESDLCYYRVYRSNAAITSLAGATQVGSTLATSFIDNTSPPAGTTAAYYAVTAVDKYGNESVVSTKTQLSAQSVSSQPAAGTISVYPNPAKQGFTVVYESPTAQRVQFVLINQYGSVLQKHSFDVAAGQNKLRLSTGAVRTGLYFVRVSSTTGVVADKVFID